MARTPQWVKKLGGHAGELFVSAELAKRGIPNALLPENFSDDDILLGSKVGSRVAYAQVKACHPDRSKSFILRASNESWISAEANSFCVFVWLGRTSLNEPPKYWIAPKREVGLACITHPAHGSANWERRFFPGGPAEYDFPPEWRDNWALFEPYRPIAPATIPGIDADANSN